MPWALQRQDVQAGAIIGSVVVYAAARLGLGWITDHWKEPYLSTAQYQLDNACLLHERLADFLPRKCVPERYKVNSYYYMLKYGLHSYGKMRSGWVRVGSDAVLLSGCWGALSCEVEEIKPNVFGPSKH